MVISHIKRRAFEPQISLIFIFNFFLIDLRGREKAGKFRKYAIKKAWIFACQSWNIQYF